MSLISHVPDLYLPTPLSRMVAIAFAALAGISASIPNILQKFGISLTPLEETLLQASWFLLFALLGVSIAFVLAVRKHTSRKSFFEV
jgi:predicted permease